MSGQKRYVRATWAFLCWSHVLYGLLPQDYEELNVYFSEYIGCAWAEGSLYLGCRMDCQDYNGCCDGEGSCQALGDY